MGIFRSLTNQGLAIDSTTVVGAVLAASTGNVTLISSGAGAINVYAYNMSAVSTTFVQVRLMSGSTTAECWRAVLGVPPTSTNAIQGGFLYDSMAVSPPNFLFRTSPGDPLTYEKGNSSVSGSLAHYSLAYWRS